MSSILVPLLIGLSQAISADAYLQAQDEALPIAAAQYEQLQEEAREQESPALRIEALGLIALLARPDARALLLEYTRSDQDPEVAEYARAMLYRLTVAENVRATGLLSDEQLAAHKARVRRLAAEHRFPQRK